MRFYHNPGLKIWPELTARPQLDLEFLEGVVQNILNRVRISGDNALKELTSQYDGVRLDNLQVSDLEKGATSVLSPVITRAMEQASANIFEFHAAQKRSEKVVVTTPGVTCWRKSVPIQKVGIYVPGGSAPLFSTALMLGIPARLAGCKEIVLCTPPEKDGVVNPAILHAAALSGITKVFKVGGAQAIAAMAYGTETIPAVQKIFGPGNQFVTKAKQLVSREGIAIDLPAGPSEVMVIADEYADASFVAADLLSQAEHGADSQVVLVALNESKIQEVQREMDKQLKTMPRKGVASESLRHSLAVFFSDAVTAMDFANEYAPEHLIINTVDCEELSNRVINAGSVFLGPYSPEAAGDYASGTNHTLPTNGFAKAHSGVSLDSFMKIITFQQLTKEGIRNLGPVVETLASAENLEGHRQAVAIRLKTLG